MTIIRPSTEKDIGRITHIYAYHVATGTGTFETQAPSIAEMAARRADVLNKKLPYLVIEDSGEVLGFAYCAWFKPRPAYRFSAEDSIYIDKASQGQGLGKMLLAELIAQAENVGIRKLIAVIGDSTNKGSIELHRSCGYEHIGLFSGCGWKFDRWLDIVFMEKTLGMGQTTAPMDVDDEK